MLISNNFASKTRWSIFALGPQMHQAAPACNSTVRFSKYVVIFILLSKVVSLDYNQFCS